jgi:hypothetical protein
MASLVGTRQEFDSFAKLSDGQYGKMKPRIGEGLKEANDTSICAFISEGCAYYVRVEQPAVGH